MSKKRLNIGFLISELEDAYTKSLCEGAVSAAKELDANLFVFPGKYLDADYKDIYRTKYDYQHNSVFDYAKTSKFDVLLVSMGTIASSVDMEAKKRFLDKFEGIPVISISAKVPGYPYVCFDNTSGFKDGIWHLIKEHDCKNIGFVSGPTTSEDACERLDAFREVMKTAGLPVLGKQIVYGNFSEYSQDIVKKLLTANPDLDAVVFANDMMAIGGYEVFKEQGIKVGEDIKVIGFDNAPHAATMEPGLSTVRADALELGYRSVISFPDIVAGRVKELTINSEFLARESCGCRGSVSSRVDLIKEDFMLDADSSEVLDRINSFLFGANSIQSGAGQIKTKVAEYYFYIKKLFTLNQLTRDHMNDLGKSMKNLCRMHLEPYTNIERIFKLFERVFHIVMAELSEEQRDQMTVVFFDMFKDAAQYTKKKYDSKEDDAFWLNAIATTFTRDILNFSIDDDRAYYSIVDKMSLLYFRSAYICLMDEYVIRKNGEETKIPDKLLLKAYLKDGAPYYVEEPDQVIQVDRLLNRLYDDMDERVTVLVHLLFSTNEQFGIFISDINEEHLNFVLPISYQISSSVKTIELLRNKEVITAQLEKSLAQIKESNAILDELSKSDELTQIYNRRGFLTTAQHKMLHPGSMGKEAVLIFADMNNLKIINDQFGHEEGDYSLKLIATILKETFADGIVGRLGGDEFVAFALVDYPKPTEVIRKKIGELTKSYNEGNDKPYYVSMSVGVCEFVCTEKSDIQDIMDKADVDLYIEKKHKRNNVMK